MNVSFVTAYRDLGCIHRRAAFAYALAFYADIAARVKGEVVVESDADPFTRASGLNAAVARARGDVIVQFDPDSIVPDPGRVLAAAEVAEDRVMVVPHDRYLYLMPTATYKILARTLDPGNVGASDCEEHGFFGWGNAVVFHRDVWETAGGYDERFGLWAGDDAAFAYAVEAHVGKAVRFDGDVVHLWHPRHPDSVPHSPGYLAQFSLLSEYRDAAAVSPEAVRQLVRARG